MEIDFLFLLVHIDCHVRSYWHYGYCNRWRQEVLVCLLWIKEELHSWALYGESERYLSKTLLRLNPIQADYRGKKQKYCATCGNLATMDAYFDVGLGVTSIEKYCNRCSKELEEEVWFLPTVCELCGKGENYHTCSSCSKNVCIPCFNRIHFGIGAPRAGKSIVYNKCMFCNSIFASNAKCGVCGDCEVVLTWKSSMNYLSAVNRISKLINEGKLDPKLRNEKYCVENFEARAAQVIMDAIDSSSRDRK